MPPPAPTRKRPRMGSGNDKKKQQNKDERNRWKQHNARFLSAGQENISGLPLAVSVWQHQALEQTQRLMQTDYTDSIFPSLLEQEESPTSSSTTNGIAASGTAAPEGSSSSMMQPLWNRVEQATTAPDAAASQQQRQEQYRRRQQQQETVQQWLRALHGAVQDEKRKQRAQHVRHIQQSVAEQQPAVAPLPAKTSLPVAVAALEHLYQFQVDENKKRLSWPRRRGSLFCAGQLLQKSADARRWWLDPAESEESTAELPDDSNSNNSNIRLAAWIQQLTTPPKNKASSTSSRNQDARRQFFLWQAEACHLLQHLVVLGYGDFYPSLRVALERLRQTSPQLAASGSAVGNQQQPHNNNSNMADWRRQRDLALQYVDQEEERVRKLLRRCQACLLVLVPRLVVDEDDAAAPTASASLHSELAVDRKKAPATETLSANAKETATTTQNVNNDAANDGNDDDAIDWEDGWEDENMDIAEEEPISHAVAVERTMAVMESTAGIQGGELVIDLQRQQGSGQNQERPQTFGSDDGLPSVDDNEPEIVLARQRLQKCARLLNDRHVVRLSSWVEGLTLADGLVLREEEVVGRDGAAVETKPSGLVALPQEQARRRRPVLNRLVELKSSVASMLQTVRRLGPEFHSKEDDNVVPSETAPSIPTASRSNIAIRVGQQQNESTSSAIRSTRQVATGATSHRSSSNHRSHRIQIRYLNKL